MRRFLLSAVVMLTISVTAWSVAPPPAEYQNWTIDDVIGQEAAHDLAFSPNGRFLLYAKTSANKEKNAYITHLFRYDIKTKRTVQLTRGTESCTAGRWSPDGEYIAFLSSRAAPKEKGEKGIRRIRNKSAEDDPKTQIWLFDATGGEPWPLTDGSRSVAVAEWSSDDMLIFAAQEDPTRRESSLKDERKDTTEVVEDEMNEPPVRLFSVDVSSKKVQRLTENRDRIDHLWVSPDGKYAVTSHSRSLRFTYDNKIKPIYFLHHLEKSGKAPRRVLTESKWNVSQVVWGADSKGFYATHERSRKPELNMAGVTELVYHELASGEEKSVQLDWPRGLTTQDDNAGSVGVLAVKGGFVALLADGVRNRVARFDHANNKVQRRWMTGEYSQNIFGFSVAPGGKRIALAHSTASSPTSWQLAKLGKTKWTDPEPVITLNSHLRNRRIARSEVVSWLGANKEKVEGILYYPHGWKSGKPAPLVVQIHGGPAAADHDSWDENWAYSANLVCQRGAFVLRLNYHGSTGYGLDWVESISDGRYCDLEVEDIEKGVDFLIAKGLVDKTRLALTGWSNGAILTNVLITRTTRYRAAVAGAGTVEYISDWSSCEFGEAFDRYYLGKSPLEDPGLYLRKSPFYQLDRVRTPTLLFFGTEDRVVHPQQGWAMYRGLQQLGKTPVRFVQFPGEKHGLKTPSHCLRKLEEEMAWLDKYLFETSLREKPELVKPDSPLGWMVARSKARRVGKLFGVTAKNILVPETVRLGSMTLGRFEVTRAQYAKFEPNLRIEPGTENYPMTKVSFEKAQAYCAWLSKATGQKYRLPTESEAEELYESSEEGENTLDLWAGYTVNPEDAGRLRVELEKLQDKSLLREVGSGRGKGKEGNVVFDLGGNAAEWVEGKNGKGISRGGSADSPADTRGKTLRASENYQGFRVVLD